MRSPAPLLSLAMFSLLALTGCGLLNDNSPVTVAIIGDTLQMTDPDKGRPTPAAQALLHATAQGLVSYDAAGQIEPGLAASWIVTDDGLSYIFRIRDAQWADGERVTTSQIVTILRAHGSRSTRNRYARELDGIATIKAMTSRVIEIRLSRPVPHLLDILAQPDMALLRKNRGWGPFKALNDHGGMLLTERADPLADDSVPGEEAGRQIRVIARPAAQALARYKNDAASAILGGRMADFPLFTASAIDRRRLVVDPAEGIFGLVFAHNDGLLADRDVREAISMAIARKPLVDAFGEPSWSPVDSIRMPIEEQDADYAPIVPDFRQLSLADRRAQASRAIAAAVNRSGRTDRPKLRIALPKGPGSDLLIAFIDHDLSAVGLGAVQVRPGAAADLFLIDEVAPSRDPFWYLRRLSCGRRFLCNSAADMQLATASATRDPAERARLFADAETTFIKAATFIPLAQPLRWSITSPRTPGLRSNPRARHPLNQLVARPT